MEKKFINAGQPVIHFLLLTVWTLSTKETLREVAGRFGFLNRGRQLYFVYYNCVCVLILLIS